MPLRYCAVNANRATPNYVSHAEYSIPEARKLYEFKAHQLAVEAIDEIDLLIQEAILFGRHDLTWSFQRKDSVVYAFALERVIQTLANSNYRVEQTGTSIFISWYNK